MSRPAAPGWFGKLAMLGDFASRRLASPWTQACDRWLSEGIEASRAQLGERWLQVYLSAPVWRLACAPGVIDTHWWFGVLMPSCDRVGRYFPLVVAQSRAWAPVDRGGLDHLERWWGHVAQAALRTLDEGATLEAFEGALAQAPPWPGAAPAGLVEAAPAPRRRYAFAPGMSLGQAAHALAARSLLDGLDGCSLWSPWGEPSRAPRCTVVRGLPKATDFGAMLAGRW